MKKKEKKKDSKKTIKRSRIPDWKTLLWFKQHLTALKKPWIWMLVLLDVLGMCNLYAKGKKYSDLVVAVLDWNAVVAVSPYAKEGDKAVDELWKKEEARIMDLAKQLQAQLDAKPQQEKMSFEEQAKRQIADEIQKASQLVQQETLKYVELTISTIRGIVERYCKRNKIDLVINKQWGILYSDNVIDITDDIVEEVKKLKFSGR